MKGQAYINDKDIWLTWKASLVKGCYEALLKPAPMKDYISNTSRLEHGKRIIATSTTAKTDERSINLNIFIEGSTESEYLTNLAGFMSEVEKGLFTFKVPALGKSYKLVYTDCSSYGNYGKTRGKFTLKLTEPNTKDRDTIV